MRSLWTLIAVIHIAALNGQSQPPVPPSPPAVTPPTLPYLPLVIVNNTGLPPDQVNFIIKGFTLPGDGPLTSAILSFNTDTGVGTLVPLSAGDNTNNYSLSL